MRTSPYESFNHYKRERAKKHPEKILQNRVDASRNLLEKMGFTIGTPAPDVYQKNMDAYLAGMKEREAAYQQEVARMAGVQ